VPLFAESVTEIESPKLTDPEPSPEIILRRPIGSRRPSFVTISNTTPTTSPLRQTSSREATDGDDATAAAHSSNATTDEHGAKAGAGRNLRGEQGNLAQQRMRGSQKPAAYDSKSCNDDQQLASEKTASTIPTVGNPARPPPDSPLHAPAPEHCKPRGSRVSRHGNRGGPDAPEAAPTEFTVAYSLAKATGIISRICQVDLGKEVYRRKEGNKLRVENRVGSGEPRLVASVELRAVSDDLTHVTVRRSKSDHGKTSLAAVWVFYDDLVTQLEVLAQSASAVRVRDA
jgi:hypothetical protein